MAGHVLKKPRKIDFPTDEQVAAQLTPEIREKFLEQLYRHPGRGYVRILRDDLGLKGTRLQLGQLVKTELADEATSTRYHAARDALFERAVNGVVEKIYSGDKVIGERVVFSDRLLAKIADWLPESRQTLEVGGVGGGPIRVEVEGGRRAITLGDVLELAASLGIVPKGVGAGDDAGPPRRALPAAETVRADPADAVAAPGAVPAPRPA